LKQAEAEYERQAELASRQVSSKAALDKATADRDSRGPSSSKPRLEPRRPRSTSPTQT
jgi:multidrug resistance efflux pump